MHVVWGPDQMAPGPAAAAMKTEMDLYLRARIVVEAAQTGRMGF